MKIKLLIMIGFLITSGINARYIPIKNDVQFAQEINKFEFALVCFLHNTQGGKYVDKNLRKDIKMLEKTIEATSDTQPFHKLLRHEVGFLVVDASKDSVDSLIKKYAIVPDEMPQFLLFHNGKVVYSVSGEYAKLVGFVSKADLLDFIDDYFGKALDDILAQKADDQEADKEMQLARYAAYANSRYPYGLYAPYNAYGPYSWYGYRSFYENGGYWGQSFYIP